MRPPWVTAVRATVWILLATLLAVAGTPGAAAGFCRVEIGVCVHDDAYRLTAPGCDGTWRVTGLWFTSSDLSLYAIGEDRQCPAGYAGGNGMRAGVVLFTFDAEARWYDPAQGECETAVRVLDFDAGADCLLGPPPLPWGNVLP